MKRTLALMMSLLFVVMLCACGGEKWPTSGLGAMLPKPSAGTVKSINEFDQKFSAMVESISKDGYENYVSACKDKGFTVDAEEAPDYTAFNEDGYKLRLNYMESSKMLDIDLDKPIEMGTLRWPDSALGKAVPKPDSDKGKVETDTESQFIVYVGGFEIDKLDSYIEACIKAGFTVDYDRGDKYYHAYDKNNYYLKISYEGFQTICIEASVKEEETTATQNTDDTKKEDISKSAKADSSKTDSSKSASSASSSSNSDSGEVSADFKEMMDEYESFMDSYVDFMQRYKDSDNPASMMAEYSEMMKKYSEFMNKVNAVNTNDLSAADYAYYLEVTARVNKKLASVA